LQTGTRRRQPLAERPTRPGDHLGLGHDREIRRVRAACRSIRVWDATHLSET
jgi:hypothetical protein